MVCLSIRTTGVVGAGVSSNLHADLHTSSRHWKLCRPQPLPRPHPQQLQQRHTPAKDKGRLYILDHLRSSEAHKLFLRAEVRKL